MNRKIYRSNNILSLTEYLKNDDRALYANWHDPGTQKGYNGFTVGTFEEFHAREIRQRFFAMIKLNDTRKVMCRKNITLRARI